MIWAPVGDVNIANQESCIDRGLAALSNKDDFSSYLYYLMLNLRQTLDVHNGNRTTLGAINKEDLHGITIIIPLLPVLTKEKWMRLF